MLLGRRLGQLSVNVGDNCLDRRNKPRSLIRAIEQEKLDWKALEANGLEGFSLAAELRDERLEVSAKNHVKWF